MPGILVRETREMGSTETSRERPREVRGRRWSDTSTNCGRPRIAGSPQKVGKGRRQVPLRVSRRDRLCRRVWTPGLQKRENSSLVLF